MNRLIWKTEKVLFISSLIISIFLVFSGNPNNGIVSLLLLISLLFGACIASKRNSLVLSLVSIYVWFVGPFSLLIATLLPSVLKGTLSFSIMDYIGNYSLILSYCYKLLVFYFVFVVLNQICGRLIVRKQIRIVFSVGIIDSQIIIPFSLLFAIAEYLIRKTFSISIPGRVPTIPFAGVILFIIHGIENYIMFVALYRNVVMHRTTRVKHFLVVLMVAVITQFPNILLGVRGGIVSTFITIAMYYLIYVFDNHSISFSSKRKTMVFGSIAVVVLLVGVGIVNLIRVGQFETLGFLINRFTGLLDGLIALYEIGNNGAPFSISSFFLGSGVSPNSYYTHAILGYPETAVHSNALPIFVGEWFFGGMLGIIVLTCFECILLSIFERLYKENIITKNNGVHSFRDSGVVYCSICSILHLIIYHFIDGNITSWKEFAAFIVCYYLILITKQNRDSLVDKSYR